MHAAVFVCRFLLRQSLPAIGVPPARERLPRSSPTSLAGLVRDDEASSAIDRKASLIKL